MNQPREALTGKNIAGVQFRRAGKIYNFDTNNLDVIIGDFVVVESERGQSIAQIVKLDFLLSEEIGTRAIKPILRRAGKKELANNNRLDKADVVTTTETLVKKHKLKMRILSCESQFGGSKMIIYFTSPGRVDFRDLVRELAGQLKTRIELKQVGARDEAKLLGGIGICGREYCCSSFLREFVPVSIRMAKNQNLAINPSKVSGGCGRLLCCLTYEDSTYSSLRRKLPPKGATLSTHDGMVSGRVIRTDLLNQLASVIDSAGIEHTLPLKDYKIENSAEEEQESIPPIDPAATEWAESLNLEALEAALQSLDHDGKEKKRTPNTTHQKQSSRNNRQNRNRSQRADSQELSSNSKSSSRHENNPSSSSSHSQNQPSKNKGERGRNRPGNPKPTKQSKQPNDRPKSQKQDRPNKVQAARPAKRKEPTN